MFRVQAAARFDLPVRIGVPEAEIDRRLSARRRISAGRPRRRGPGSAAPNCRTSGGLRGGAVVAVVAVVVVRRT